MGKKVFDTVTRRLRVLRRPCDTCIFNPGNLMHLRPGRRDQMVAQCLAKDGYITCHDTLPPGTKAAVCRGFFNRHARDVLPLRAAIALDIIEHVDPPLSHLAPAAAPEQEEPHENPDGRTDGRRGRRRVHDAAGAADGRG